MTGARAAASSPPPPAEPPDSGQPQQAGEYEEQTPDAEQAQPPYAYNATGAAPAASPNSTVVTALPALPGCPADFLETTEDGASAAWPKLVFNLTGCIPAAAGDSSRDSSSGSTAQHPAAVHPSVCQHFRPTSPCPAEPGEPRRPRLRSADGTLMMVFFRELGGLWSITSSAGGGLPACITTRSLVVGSAAVEALTTAAAGAAGAQQQPQPEAGALGENEDAGGGGGEAPSAAATAGASAVSWFGFDAGTGEFSAPAGLRGACVSLR